MTEDEQIDAIGKAAMTKKHGKPPVIGVAVDDDAKADRYIAKLKERFPLVIVLSRHNEFLPGSPDTVLFKVSHEATQNPAPRE